MTNIDIDALIERSAIEGQIAGGASAKWVIANSADPTTALVMARGSEREVNRPMPWSKQDFEFVRQNVGFLSDAEMAAKLGRTEIAVKIKRTRLALGSTTRRIDYFTSRSAAVALGIGCSKKITDFIRKRLLRGYNAPLDCTIHQIHIEDLKRFACNPDNWIYFDPKKVEHPEIRRLVLRQMRRWNDEWWKSSQVAEYLGIDITDISRYIRLGRIPGKQYQDWYVRRSVATDPSIVIYKGKGGTNRAISDNYSAWDALLVMGVAAGMSYAMVSHISKTKSSVPGRYQFLMYQGKLREVVQKYDLPVHVNAAGVAWMPCSEACKRFHFMRKAVTRFLAGEPCTGFEYRVVGGVLYSWARYHAVTPEQKALAERLKTISRASTRAVQRAWEELKAWGIGDPLQ